MTFTSRFPGWRGARLLIAAAATAAATSAASGTAAQETIKAGGINGRSIEAVQYDCGANATKAPQLTRCPFESDKVLVRIGASRSRESLPLLPTANALKTPPVSYAGAAQMTNPATHENLRGTVKAVTVTGGNGIHRLPVGSRDLEADSPSTVRMVVDGSQWVVADK